MSYSLILKILSRIETKVLSYCIKGSQRNTSFSFILFLGLSIATKDTWR